MTTTIGRWVVAGLLGLAIGCGTTDEVPAGVDESTLADSNPGKSDAAGVYWVKNEGALACAQTRNGRTGPASLFDGYTFDLKTGDKIGFDATANAHSRLLVYGPQRSGRWGAALAAQWVAYDATAATYRGQLKHTAQADGRYLVVLGSYSRPMRYELGLFCDGQPHCVEYTATDESGTSLRNFYSINVDSYVAGKDHIAQLAGHFVEESITQGHCADHTTACGEIYAPVCATDITPDSGPEPQQFGNLCEFKNAVRLASIGSEWQGAKGHTDEGECAPAQCTPGEKNYVGTPETCQRIRYTCAFDQGFTHFSDEQGCGCVCPTEPPQQWYPTCGTPVCFDGNDDPAYLAIPVCDAAAGQAEGNSCSGDGQCRPEVYDCGRLLKCQTEQPLVCPRSQRHTKRDIKYLDEAALQKVSRDLLGTRLATYQYKKAPAGAPHRLGFIIEDQVSPVAVDGKREHVDVYGYASMAVATLQVQARQIEALKAELAAMKAKVEALTPRRVASAR